MFGTVRLKRGAGAGWTTPSTSTNVSRARLWGWAGASASESTGAKQTSLPSMISHHSSRVFVRKIAANRSVTFAHSLRSNCPGREAGSTPVRSSSSA